jgi:hypothetical protein
MKIASLAIGLGFVGLCLPAHADLIGSTVDLQEFFPDLATMTADHGSTTVSGAVEYPSVGSFAVDITGSQILITWPGPGSLGFTTRPFNGYEFLFSGVAITGATADASSGFNPFAISLVGNNVFLNYQGVNTGVGPTTSIIDVTTSASTAPSAVPEPGTLPLLGAGLLGLGLLYKRQTA